MSAPAVKQPKDFTWDDLMNDYSLGSPIKNGNTKKKEKKSEKVSQQR